MKWLVSILLITISFTAIAREKKSTYLFDNRWEDFMHKHQKENNNKNLWQWIFNRKKNRVTFEAIPSVLQQKLLNHEISAPQLKPVANSVDMDLGSYLKWVYFFTDKSKRMFPTLIQRPTAVYTSKLMRENFIQIGLNLPF